MKKTSNKGFTLVELIIVIAILAIIVMIAGPKLAGIRESSAVKADKISASEIAKTIRIWYTERETEDKTVISDSVLAEGVEGEQGLTVLKEGATPVPYSKLEDIARYISKDLKPKSLTATATGAAISEPQYSVILSGADRATAKIVVIIEEAGDEEGAEKWTVVEEDDLVVDYDGKGPGVAFIEN